MKYQSVMDLHTHTVASGHAYCTLREMARAASDKGLDSWESQSMHRKCPEPVISFISRI